MCVDQGVECHSRGSVGSVFRMWPYSDHMSKMKNVGVREFRDHATKYLAGPETVAVNRHGRVIGFYIPLKRDEDEVRRARPGRRAGAR
jgi:hypothetical protein